jgi:integration host factor subunit beta
MTKRELIDEIAATRRVPLRHELNALVNAVFESLTEALARGERIEVRGFGSFIIKRRRERVGRNPKTGDAVTVHAKRVPFFKAGKEIKLRVDSKGVRTSLPSDRGM